MNDHFENLAAKWLADEATEAEVQQLLSICRQSPDDLQTLAELVSIDRLLPLLDEPADLFGRELLDRLAAGDDAQFATRVRRRIGPPRRPALLASLALAAAAIVLLFLLPNSRKAPIAKITSNVAAAWEQDFAPVDGTVSQGHYRLLRGLVSLRFDSGVSMIVEGPAEFDVVTAERVLLVDGTVTAQVPKGAEGFTIDTNSTRVIDRGTEFAVTASRTGDTEIHVLDGIVEAHPLTAPDRMVRLLEHEALIYNHGGSTEAVADPSRFFRQMPSAPSQLNWLHWPFNEGSGHQTRGLNHRLADADVVARFATIEDGPPNEGPQWTDGMFGTAIEFDGRDDYLQTDFEGIGGTQARTVAFWVRVPEDWRPTQGYGMVSWGSYEYEGATWQISVNPIAKEGPLGRLRVGINRGQVIGETDLRDGRWHHVAAVMYGGGDANTATHVILFLDGEFERASKKSILSINTDVESDTARKVLIGRNSSLQTSSYRCFRGAIDEVYLIDAALDQEEIRRLMSNQSPR